ncbi:hypothetical protein M422DRAFT_48043 [Sphaerobolus stellatus SS14]|uniref:Endonuclease/exonuclease/phosphatase domain-containing protein n=1 Tax=Sphaerobolus stellatus (strain SS14) TaxID=990650 RepID=A0A0C9UIZ9_SPHS4|nr:hypothetical protein M422DRAFT_48043 [Sphaerobolus stellatus SS14]
MASPLTPLPSVASAMLTAQASMSSNGFVINSLSPELCGESTPNPIPGIPTPTPLSTSSATHVKRACAKSLKATQNSLAIHAPIAKPMKLRIAPEKESTAKALTRVDDNCHTLHSNVELVETTIVNHINAMSESMGELTTLVDKLEEKVDGLRGELCAYGKQPAAAPTDMTEWFTQQDAVLVAIWSRIGTLEKQREASSVESAYPKHKAVDDDDDREECHEPQLLMDEHTCSAAPLSTPAGSIVVPPALAHLAGIAQNGGALPVVPAPMLPVVPVIDSPAAAITNSSVTTFFGPATWGGDVFASWKGLIKPMKHAAYWSTVAIKARISHYNLHALITFPDKHIARTFEAEWMAAPTPGFEDIGAHPPHECRMPTGAWVPYATNLLITCWNVNGHLALKLRQPRFCRIIKDCDIILLQETHLTPGQEDTLRLPHCYLIWAISREPDHMSPPHGGVTIVYKSCFQPTLCKQWSAVDFMVLDFESFFLANIYAPLASSRSAGRDFVEASLRLQIKPVILELLE